VELVITVGDAPALLYLFLLTRRLRRTELKRNLDSIYTANESHSYGVSDAAVFLIFWESEGQLSWLCMFLFALMCGIPSMVIYFCTKRSLFYVSLCFQTEMPNELVIK